MTKKREGVTREEFDDACEALWTELRYQDSLTRRTDDEAKSVGSFLSILRRYTRRCEDDYSDNPGIEQRDGQVQVSKALHGLRKLSAIALRAMIYNGIRQRGEVV
jgi:hypothetical protein